MDRTAIVVSGGGGAPAQPLPRAALVVAADSGLHLANDLGLAVDLVVGDLDSADPALVDEARQDGATVEVHPADKDATDLDLAMEAARARGATRVVVIGGGGGRLDHLLGIALLLCSDRWSGLAVEWWTDRGEVRVVRGAATIPTRPGDLVSVLPVTPTATISIGGTRWTLDRDRLDLGSTRGISNEATGDAVALEVEPGTALVVVTR